MSFKQQTSIFFLSILLLCSCNDKGGDEIEFDRNTLLVNYADNIIMPRYEKLMNASNLLHSSSVVFANNINQTNLDALRLEFTNTYLAWQACSSTDFGPAGMLTLKATFNTYPTDTNQINLNITNGTYNLETAQNISASGLPAIDFLLYGTATTDASILNYFTNNPASLAYLQDLTDQLKSKATQVSTEWTSSYRTSFIQADGTDVGSSLGLLVNEMNLDFEKFIRDGKVGIPLGIRSLGTPQLDKTEAYYSGISLALVEESVVQLQNLLTGTSTLGVNGIGIDDYLDAAKASHNGNDLSAVMATQFTEILTAVQALNSDLSTEIQNNPSEVEDLYYKMQGLIVYLKVDLASNLGILISYQDNDGD